MGQSEYLDDGYWIGFFGGRSGKRLKKEGICVWSREILSRGENAKLDRAKTKRECGMGSKAKVK